MSTIKQLSRPIVTRALAASVAMALSLSCTTTSTVLAQPTGIPSLGVASAFELSPAMERTLGAAIMEQGWRDPSYVDDLGVNQYLTSMGQSLAAHAPGATGLPVTVFAVRDSQINAFALPGGYVGINSGLVVAAQSESELASVVAHEIGHMTQRHIARGMTQSKQTNHMMLAALAGALLAALSGSGDLAMGVAAFGQAAAIDRQLGFSRQAEQEADRAGYEMMRRAGYDPRGMVRMFKRLGAASHLNEGAGANPYASTHPLSAQRLADIETRIAPEKLAQSPDSSSFWYVRAKLRVLQARDARARAQVVEQLTRDSTDASGIERAAAAYGLAFAAWAAKDYQGAVQALSTIKAEEDSAQVATLRVKVALDQGDLAQGLRLAQQAWSTWPRQQAVALTLANALQANGQDDQAIAFLEERIEQWPGLPQLHRTLAQSYERVGSSMHASRSMARYYELTGALPTAIEHLQQARTMSTDFYVQSELDVQIRELKGRLLSDRALLERFKSS